MKEYEKLAHDLSNIQLSNVRLTEQVDCRFSRGFVTGFLKAREMAVDILGQQLDPATSIYEVLKLGEKEV